MYTIAYFDQDLLHQKYIPADNGSDREAQVRYVQEAGLSSFHQWNHPYSSFNDFAGSDVAYCSPLVAAMGTKESTFPLDHPINCQSNMS